MNGRTIRAALLAAAGVLSALGGATLAAPVAVAAEESLVPDDVREWFAGRTSEFVTSDDAPFDGFSAGDTAGPVFAVTRWSSEFTAGTRNADPLTPLDQWITALIDDDGPLGTVTAWRPEPDAAVEGAGYDTDVALATALLDLPADCVLVFDGPSGGWLAVREGKVWGVNDWAVREVPEPIALADYRPVLAARYAAALADGADPSQGMAGGGGAAAGDPIPPAALPIGIATGAALLVVGGVLLARRRRAAAPGR